MPTITVTPNTNIVLVNTASADQTTVNLPPVTPGQLITIRDNVGAASSNNPITITTTGGSIFSTGTVLPDGNSNILIRQPFGAVTVGYSGGLKWNILNTFAFENPTFAKVDAVTVSSITFRDSGGNGNNYQLKVLDDILYKDANKIIEAPEFNLGIARHNGGVSSLSSIVSYGLSTVAAHPHYGLSSLSSIVSYGLSSFVATTPSNWATYPATSNINMSNYSITNLSNITVNGVIGGPSKSLIVVSDGIKLQTVLNGVSQGSGTTFPSFILDIYYNGSLWVAGGVTNGFIYYSSDGSNWTINTTKTFNSGKIYNIIYADNKWVAVGEKGLAYSTYGFIWTNNINLINVDLRCVAYNNNNWVIGGIIGNSWTFATLNNITLDFTPATSGGFTYSANRVLYANNIWVAVGSDTNNAEIQYSTNGSQWYPALNVDAPDAPFFDIEQGKALAYGNGYWLAGGNKYIYISSDGSNFNLLYTFSDDTGVRVIKYEGGSTFYATYTNNLLGSRLVKSTDNGSNWSNILNITSFAESMGISYTPAVTGIDNILIGGGAVTTTNINASNINASNINASNINASNITVGGTLMVGGVQITGGDSISNWATYFANSNLDMGQCNIINVVDISMTGQLTLPKFTTIVFGNPTENLSIGNNNVDSLSYLKLSGPTYIDGTLTLSSTNIIGPNGTLTYNDDPIGGGDASTWSANVATQNVNINGCNISNVNSLQFGTTPNVISLTTYIEDESPYLLVNGIANTVIDFNGHSIKNAGSVIIKGDVTITGEDAPNGLNIIGPLNVSNDTTIIGTLTVGGVSITGGGSASNWATYVATSNLNMGGCNISNVNNIEVKSVTEFPSNTTLLIPSFTDNTGRINRVLNGNNVGFVNLGTNEIIYDIFYNNSLWVAVGETSPSLGYIYTSSNGTTWNKSASAILLGSAVSRNIIYASNIWALVGFTTADEKIAYSTDGYNWSRNPNTINVGLHCIGYNGSNKWVIGGQSNGWTLATLDNITSGTFTPATGGFTDAAFRVLYANNIWVAVGRDTNNAEIQYSTNGSQWYPALNVDEPDTSFFSLEGKALAYGNGYWLAGGDGNDIYGSSNGINFSVFHVVGSGLTVDDIKYESGSTFYATFKSSSSNILVKSTDNGSNWSIITYIGLNSAPSRIGISYIPSYFVNSNTIIGGGTLNTSNLIVSNKLTLNNNTFTTLVNPVGAYIEITNTTPKYLVTYPLYIGNSINITPSNNGGSTGWWIPHTLDKFTAIILLPNYTIVYDYATPPNNTLTRSNTSNIPSYTALTGDYQNSLYYTLTYTPT